MTLASGTQLGRYEIRSQIGAGGMGEVYRARDEKLNRDVAIKILPEALAQDSDRLARFKREAQVLASLNHNPRIRQNRLLDCEPGARHPHSVDLRQYSTRMVLRMDSGWAKSHVRVG